MSDKEKNLDIRTGEFTKPHDSNLEHSNISYSSEPAQAKPYDLLLMTVNNSKSNKGSDKK